MDSPLPPLTVDTVDALKAAGMTQSDVARLYGVTRAAVSAVVRRNGGRQTPRQLAAAVAWPWKVPARMHGQQVYRMLRDHLEYVAGAMLLAGNLPTSNKGYPKLLTSNLLTGNLGEPNLSYSPVTLLASNIDPGAASQPASRPNPASQAKPANRSNPDNRDDEQSNTYESGMSYRKLEDLRRFYLRMSDRVIEFDPDLPPSEGVSVGGFAYRPRLPEDGDLLIRVNDHTTLTDAGREMWRMPAVLPAPVARYRGERLDLF
jgi:hypothetical protein